MRDNDVRNKERAGNGMPTAEPKQGRRQRVRKTPLTLTLDLQIIETYGEIAKALGISRAATMTLALTKFMDRQQR